MRIKRDAGITVCVLSLLLVVLSGFAETIITAQDYAVDSDVVLESAVQEIKSIPHDTVSVIGDGAKYVADEASVVHDGIRNAFKTSEREKTSRQGELEIEKAWMSSNEILFRSYKISETVGRELTQGVDGLVEVSSAFAGIGFPEGTSAYYRPGVRQLFVRQTFDNILKIEDLLAEQHNAQLELLNHQVEIETKLIEVSQRTLNELGFSWEFVGKNGGDANIFDNLVLPSGQDILAGGLRNSAMAINSGVNPAALLIQKADGSLRWSMIINALEQAEDSDVLCAPRIVTRDGNTATIEVGEDRMVPKSFAADSQNTSVYVEHTDWDTELMGVTLKVTPTLRPNDMIDLEIEPTVIDLIGYDEYQVTPGNAYLLSGSSVKTASGPINLNDNGPGEAIKDYFEGLGALIGSANLSFALPDDMQKNQSVPVPELTGKLPYFRVRKMETRVTVADGSTVGMGGLIYDKLETFKDKVPVLGSIPLVGRLFRSEGEKSVKRNLMVFVTATQVDVNGRRSAETVLTK